MHRRSFLIAVGTGFVEPAFAQAGSSEPNARQQEAITTANLWLDYVEAADDERSFALMSPLFRGNLTQSKWREVMIEANTRLGKMNQRKLRRVVWYTNPATAPLPGLYAAVEFDGSYENADQHFQYVILHSEAALPFKVMRHESRYALNRK